MAKGYGTSADIIFKTRDGQDLNRIWDDYEAALRSFNETRQPLISLLASPLTEVIEDITPPGQERFERASEFGIPQSIRPAPAPTQRAYPFEWWDLRAAYTFQFLNGGNSGAPVSSRQLDLILSQAMEADNALQFDLVMKALFNSANRTASVTGLPYTVTALYNADGAFIPTYKGTSFNGATHTHYLGTGAGGQTKFDPGDFIELAGTVEHHGYTRAQGYNIVFLMNPADAQASVQNFVRNTAFNNGIASPVSLYDFIAAQGQNTTLMLPPGYTLAGGLPNNTFAGMEVLGSWGPYLIVQDAQIPLGYMVAVATAGQSTTTNVIGIREHETASMRGLILKPGNNNAYPLIDSYFIRGMGTGVRQRGAAAVMQLNVASGSYAVPASMAW
jgi:hypothetical protein